MLVLVWLSEVGGLLLFSCALILTTCFQKLGEDLDLFIRYPEHLADLFYPLMFITCHSYKTNSRCSQVHARKLACKVATEECCQVCPRELSLLSWLCNSK